jgi:hypothetical protein
MQISYRRRQLQSALWLAETLGRRLALVFALLFLAVAPAIAQADWAKFRDIGGVFPAGAPITAVGRNPNQIDLFVTGLNGHVYTSSYTVGGDWTGIGHKWKDIGGVFPAGAPIAAVSRNPNQIDLFITGHNGHVYTSFMANGGPWSGEGDKWMDIGGVFTPAAPLAAIARKPNLIDVFVTGQNGHVYTSWYSDGNQWSGLGDKWLDIGGVFPVAAPLSVIARNPSQLDVFVTGLNGNVYTSFYVDGGQWSGFGDKWIDIGGVFNPGAPVAAISRNPNQIDLFITGQNGDVYTSWYIDGQQWSGIGNKWTDIGGVFPAAAKISAVTRKPSRIDLFVSGLNGDVYTSWYDDGGQWSGLGNKWSSVGGSFPAGAPLAALSRQPDLLDVFVTGHDGVVYTSFSVDGGNPPPPPGPGPGPGPGGGVTVLQPVDVYSEDEGGGQVVGVLEEGTQGVTLVGACHDGWCHVNWPEGDGYVYDGDGYDSLRY